MFDFAGVVGKIIVSLRQTYPLNNSKSILKNILLRNAEWDIE